MGLEDARLDRIPNFVSASSPQGLRRAMLRNNVRAAFQFVYHDIQFVNGKWFAWFYDKTNEAMIDADRSGEAQRGLLSE